MITLLEQGEVILSSFIIIIIIMLSSFNQVDIAFTVTDALFAAKSTGRKVKLIGTYIKSPLHWGVFTAGSKYLNSSIKKFNNFSSCINDSTKVGVSRIGSGSHTMAYYASNLHNRNPNNLEVVIANNIDGLKNGVNDGTFDYFLWETFTTKPLVDKGELHEIGVVPTPWTAFSIAMSNDKEKQIKTSTITTVFYPALEDCVRIFIDEAKSNFTSNNNENSITRICKDYNHKEDDAKAWFQQTEYAITNGKINGNNNGTNQTSPFSIDYKITNDALNILKDVNLVPKEYQTSDLWDNDTNIIINK